MCRLVMSTDVTKSLFLLTASERRGLRRISLSPFQVHEAELAVPGGRWC